MTRAHITEGSLRGSLSHLYARCVSCHAKIPFLWNINRNINRARVESVDLLMLRIWSQYIYLLY